MWSCMWRALPNLTGFLARGAKPIGAFGLVRGPLTIPYQSTVLAVDQYKIVLPIITGRGVKYTHDINCVILHHDSGPTRIRLISQASTQEVIVVGDGGAKHRSVDPPTTWHSVADPHAASTIDQGGPPGLAPTTTSSWAYGVYSVVER